MKKSIVVLLVLFSLCLASCRTSKIKESAYDTFFTDERLSACHVEGLPPPKLEGSVLCNGEVLYLNLTSEEFLAYTEQVASYILERNDIYFKGVFHETNIAVGPLFLPLDEQVYVPLEDCATFSPSANRFAFALGDELGSGWLTNSMRDAFEVSICFGEGTVEELGFSYTAVLEIHEVRFARYETCAKEHKYTAWLSYPVPNTDTVIRISRCDYCGTETRDAHYGDYSTAYSVSIIKGTGCIERECLSEYQRSPDRYAGLEQHIKVLKSGDTRYTVTANGFEIPMLYEDEESNCYVYGFIMPQCAVAIEIAIYEPLDEHLVFEENEHGSYTVTDYTGTAKSVMIPAFYNDKPVTAIGGYAFADCTTLEEVVIKGGVTVIEMGAFARCASLKEITLPTSLIELGTSAFLDCTAMGAITLPPSIRAVAPGCFQGCTALQSVVFPFANKKCWLSNTDRWSSTGSMVGGSQYDASDPQKNAAYLSRWPYNAIYYYEK